MDKNHTKLIQHRLTRRIRRIIMGLLFLSFFVMSPLIILYTAGYRYDITQHKIKQKGVLSVDIKPTDATVYLNNIKIDKKIPIRIADRAPGTYRLSIQREGYKSWEKDITISSNQTTYIKDITLIQDAVPQRIALDTTGILHIYGTEESQTVIILSQHDALFEILAFDSVLHSLTPIMRTTVEPYIEVSPFFDIVYIETQENNAHTGYIISLDNPQDLKTIGITSPTSIVHQWNNVDISQPLYTQENNHIMRIELAGSKTDAAQSTSTLWYIDADNALWTIENNTLSQMNSNNSFYIDEPVQQIIDINKNRIILKLIDNSTLVAKYNNQGLYDRQLISGNPIYNHHETREWWVATNWELSSIYEDGGVNLLSRSGDNIKNALLLDREGVILFVTNQGLKSFNPGYYVGHELLNEPNIEDTIALIKKRELLFLSPHDTEGYALYSLRY